MEYMQEMIYDIQQFFDVTLQYMQILDSTCQLWTPTTYDAPGQRLPSCPAARHIPIDYNSLHPRYNYACSDEDSNQAKAAGGPPSPTDFRVWESVVAGNPYRFKFKIMSYNVLAQDLLESQRSVYTGCSEDELQWEARAEKIYNEILSVSPDVICLQEVQKNHLSYFRRLEPKGYCGLYKKKTGDKVDGCALFFKTSVFTYLAYEALEYHRDDLPLLTPDNVGILVMLAPRCSPTTPIAIATTHFVYNKYNDHKRLAQMRVLMADIERFTYAGQKGYYPLIIIGDFNSKPSSSLIELLETSRIKIPTTERLDQIGLTDNCQFSWVLAQRFLKQQVMQANTWRPQTFRNAETLVTHPFKLRSVYDTDKQNRTMFCGKCYLIDYIYYTPNNLRLVERLGLPNCPDTVKIPNAIFASDHVSIAATFEMNVFSFGKN